MFKKMLVILSLSVVSVYGMSNNEINALFNDVFKLDMIREQVYLRESNKLEKKVVERSVENAVHASEQLDNQNASMDGFYERQAKLNATFDDLNNAAAGTLKSVETLGESIDNLHNAYKDQNNLLKALSMTIDNAKQNVKDYK